MAVWGGRARRREKGADGSAEKSLNLPLPEMTFGNNSLVLTYDPAASSSSSASAGQAPRESLEGSKSGSGDDVPLRISFNALEALAGVATGEGWEERVGGGVKVSMAEQWGKNR